MAPQPGTRDSEPARPESPASLAARTLSFVLLAGLALAILAGVVLLPAYARLNQIIVERDHLVAANADHQVRIEAQRRFIKAVPKDRILAKRLAMRHFGSLPRAEYVVAATEDLRAPQAGTVAIDPHPRPEPVRNWMTATAPKVARPITRRVLLTVAVVALVAAVVLTAAPGRRRKPRNTPTP